MNSTFTRVSRIGALVVSVLVLLTGPQAEAASACGSKAFAHRGAWTRKIDENTLRSIERAHRLHANTENDVFLTRDGKFLIIHDRSLRPTTNCRGKVTGRTLRNIRRHCHTTPNHMRIPTARQAFRKLRHNPHQKMSLEVKGPGWLENHHAKLKQIARAARKAHVRKRVYFSNDVGYNVLRALKQSAPRARTAWKPSKREDHFTVKHAKRLGADAVMAKRTKWNSRAKVHRFKRHGIKAWAAFTDARRVWRKNVRRGITGQLTDRPAKYRKWCRRFG
jgi:glycerophosphoryl diester phosphodiesterase